MNIREINWHEVQLLLEQSVREILNPFQFHPIRSTDPASDFNIVLQDYVTSFEEAFNGDFKSLISKYFSDVTGKVDTNLLFLLNDGSNLLNVSSNVDIKILRASLYLCNQAALLVYDYNDKTTSFHTLWIDANNFLAQELKSEEKLCRTEALEFLLHIGAITEEDRLIASFKPELDIRSKEQTRKLLDWCKKHIAIKSNWFDKKINEVVDHAALQIEINPEQYRRNPEHQLISFGDYKITKYIEVLEERARMKYR